MSVGTGKTATTEQAEEVCGAPKCCRSSYEAADTDGGLVGGASNLKADSERS